MTKRSIWDIFPFGRKSQTIGEKLAGRIDAFLVACTETAYQDRDKPIPVAASRLAFPHLSPADWIRVAMFHRIHALLSEQSVLAPSALKGDALEQMAYLTVPYILDDAEFLDLLSTVSSEREDELCNWRRAWKDALAAPKQSIVLPGESLSQALARLHSGPTFEASYELGRKSLQMGLDVKTTSFHFLAPYAIARARWLAWNGPADPAEAPPIEKLSKSELIAAQTLHRALVAGPTIIDDMATITANDEDTAAHMLAERLYVVQKLACAHLMDKQLSDPLSMDQPRRFGALNLDMCDAATLLVQHCLRSDD